MKNGYWGSCIWPLPARLYLVRAEAAEFAEFLRSVGQTKSSPERGGGSEADGGAAVRHAQLWICRTRPLRPLEGAPPRSGEDLLKDPLRLCETLRTLRETNFANAKTHVKPCKFTSNSSLRAKRGNPVWSRATLDWLT
jgi:hypothetical protein